ncbi:MAG: hypothetical protein ACI835_004261 [Planctomycetota bacterium]|jgi:hypothetical protein
MSTTLFRALSLTIGVMSVTSIAVAQGTNLALSGTTTQSSVDFNGVPERAIDNNTNGTWSAGSVTHTADQIDSWWQVDLGGVYPLSSVRLYNRQDCCFTRLSNFWVSVKEGPTEVFRQDYFMGSGSVGQGAMFEIALPAATMGDVVAIGFHAFNNDGNGFLSLAEVQVMGAIGARYCVSMPNSVGAGALLNVSGSSSMASNDLVLSAAPVPDQPGLFCYATNQMQSPFGEGFLCVTGSLTLLHPATTAVGNQAMLAIDYPSLPASAQIQAGTTWNFQHWYRDPSFGQYHFYNTTDAMSVTFTP